MLDSLQEVMKKVEKFDETGSKAELDVVLFEAMCRELVRRGHEPLEDVAEMLILEQVGNC